MNGSRASKDISSSSLATLKHLQRRANRQAKLSEAWGSASYRESSREQDGTQPPQVVQHEDHAQHKYGEGDAEWVEYIDQ